MQYSVGVIELKSVAKGIQAADVGRDQSYFRSADLPWQV